jgi:hypothetical protein
MQAGQAAPPRPSLAQTAMNPLARAYQLYQQYVGEPFQQAVRGGVRGYFGLPMMTDASPVGREAYRQGEALGFTPGAGMPAGAVRVAAEGMQALPSIAGDIGRVISGLPSGAAARQAEDFAAYQRSIPPSDVSPLTAFHGTPHTFPAEPGLPLGRFRSEKIGTGEGAQAYGYGLYFAQSPGVAKSYQTNVGDYSVTKVEGVEQINDPDFGDALVLEPTEKPEKTLFGKEAIDFLRKHIGKPQNNQNKLALNWLDVFEREGYSIEVPGRDKSSLYTVDIPDAMVDKMLDWDKPWNEQPESVRNALSKTKNKQLQTMIEYANTPYTISGLENEIKTMGEALKVLNMNTSPANASKLLQKAGIPGIRYLDRSSRDVGQGTRNIVVFPGEEQNVKILSRE